MNTTTKDVFLGLGALFAADVAAALFLGGLSALGNELPVIALYAIGLVQLLWAVPGAIWAYKSGRKGIGHGILIGAAVVLLVNGGCFALVMYWFEIGP
ncbi:MAG: hypothetical protein IPJ77_00480 [Planctomycetes bacterium]|nr:hypothetical protein [Planctomycetota bacterium]